MMDTGNNKYCMHFFILLMRQLSSVASIERKLVIISNQKQFDQISIKLNGRAF